MLVGSAQRIVDRFFHRHGYAGVDTFIMGKTHVKGAKRPRHEGYWLDHLYVRSAPRIYPPVAYPSPITCYGEDELAARRLR